MKENETQGHPSSTPAEGHGDSEKGSDLAEEPDQPQSNQDSTCLTRNERIRLIVLGLGLLALLVSFLLYLFSGTVLPLFGTMVVAFLVYRRIDAWLGTAERS